MHQDPLLVYSSDDILLTLTIVLDPAKLFGIRKRDLWRVAQVNHIYICLWVTGIVVSCVRPSVPNFRYQPEIWGNQESYRDVILTSGQPFLSHNTWMLPGTDWCHYRHWIYRGKIHETLLSTAQQIPWKNCGHTSNSPNTPISRPHGEPWVYFESYLKKRDREISEAHCILHNSTQGNECQWQIIS